MRKDKTVRTTLILTIAVLMTLSLVSGTMAKYVHATKGKDVARVAQFELEIQSYDDRGDNSDATRWTAAEASVNLFHTTTNDSGVYDASAGNFDSNGGVKLIAPGTTGGFQINVSNYSEVAVKPSFTLSETFIEDKKIPIVYTYRNLHYSSYTEPSLTVGGKFITGGLAELGVALSTQVGNLGPSNGSAAVSTPVQSVTWTWAFEAADVQTNEKDTALGVDANLAGLDPPTITLSLTCTAEQLND